jgi:hypothetical protein
MKHDASIYNLFLDLGASERASVLDPRPVESLDFAELEVPSLDPEPGRFRLLRRHRERVVRNEHFLLSPDDRG